MKILFVTHNGTSHEPLGLEYVSAALLRAGHMTRACQEKNVPKYLDSFEPDFIAFQVITGDQDRWAQVARDARKKRPGIKTIFGGPQYLFFSKSSMPEADIVIRGDAEEAIVDAVEGRKWQDLKPIEDLDSRAHPDRMLLYNDEFPGIRDNVIRNFIACQGCVYKCFVEGTNVLLYNGIHRHIQDIKVGDEVVAFDVLSGAQKKEFVTRIGSRIADDTYEVELEDGTKFGATSEHPFWTMEKWKNLESLKVGENIRRVSNMRSENKKALQNHMLQGVRLKENIHSKNRKSESDEKTRGGPKGRRNYPHETRKGLFRKMAELAPHWAYQILKKVFKIQERGRRADAQEQPNVRSGDIQEGARVAQKGLCRGQDNSSFSKLLKRDGDVLGRDHKEALDSFEAHRQETFLDRSVHIRDSQKPGFYEPEDEEGGPFQRQILAQRSGHTRSDKGLQLDGVACYEPLGGVSIAGKPEEAGSNPEIVPGEWVRIKKISFLGTRRVYSISVSNQENFVANGYLVHNCTYCYNSNKEWQEMTKGKRLRYHSPEWIVDDILMTFEKYPNSQLVSFQDDIFGIDMDWLERFTALYKAKVRIPFFAQIRPRLITEDRVKLLKEAGIHIASFAIESGNERTRREILDREEPNELIEKGCALLHKYGIKFRMQNLLGLPVADPLADALETLRFNIKCRPTLSWCSLLQAYPGTAIADYVVEKGIVPSVAELEYMVNATFFEESSLPIRDKKKVERLHKYWAAVVRWPWLYPIARVAIEANLGKRFQNAFFEKSKAYINSKEYWRVDGMARHVSAIQSEQEVSVEVA